MLLECSQPVEPASRSGLRGGGDELRCAELLPRGRGAVVRVHPLSRGVGASGVRRARAARSPGRRGATPATRERRGFVGGGRRGGTEAAGARLHRQGRVEHRELAVAEHFELIVFGLLVAVAGLVLLSDVLEVPYPIFLVLGGLVLGFILGVPEVELAPELVLLIFLPTLLYVSAFFSSLRDLKANIRPIGLLSVGLVALTTVVVAGVSHFVVGLSWPVAFVLGAI